MNIIVTGGCGYVGTELCARLAESGHNVIAVDIGVFGMNRASDKVWLAQIDFNDITEKELENCDCVIHLAGMSNDPMAHYDPLGNFRVNAADAVNLAYKAKRSGVRKFILASSASIYQGLSGASPDMDVAPKEPYAISKLMAESGCLALASDDFTVIALRKGTICGVSTRMRYDLVVNTMFKSAVQTGIIKVFVTRNGDSVMRPHLTIDQAVEEYRRYAEFGRWKSGIYNVSTANMSIMQVAELVAATTKAKIVREVAQDPTLLRNYSMRFEGQAGHGIDYAISTLKRIAPRDFDNKNYYNIEAWKEWVKR